MMGGTEGKPAVSGGQDEVLRRDFLLAATKAMAAAGAGLALWPFIDSLSPAADVRAEGSVEVDLEPIAPGQRITVAWRGTPVFISHRTGEEIAQERAANPAELVDPAPDEKRVRRSEWLVAVGVCTHLGCIPLGQAAGDPRGGHGGWVCQCHGSVYDASGRVRRGPAPRNLPVPPYRFVEAGRVRIG